MPKRLGNLIPLIAEPDNLRCAAWKASRGKKQRAEVQDFLANLDAEVAQLRSDLLLNKVEVGAYKQFRIYDPKERVISAAPFRQRVLHHAIMNYCHWRFDSYLPEHVFASRIGKGTTAAMAYASGMQERFAWFAKLDVRGYFPSIHHGTLMAQLRRLFKDSSLLYLFERIMKSCPSSDGFGLPIGNLTSQYWANHYLGCCDHYILQELRPAAYCRYMDDMVLWHTDKNQLLAMVSAIETFCAERLKLTLKAPLIQKADRGLPFIGYTFFPNHIRLNQRSKLRFRRKMKSLNYQLQTGKISQKKFQVHCLPLIEFVRKADSHSFRSSILRNLHSANG